MRYANTTYIETTSDLFEEMFAKAKASIGENPCVGFEFGGVMVIVDSESILGITNDDLTRAKVMGIGEIYKPLMDVALINEAYTREWSHSYAAKCSVMESEVYGGHIIKGFVNHEVQLVSRFQKWVMDTYGISDNEAIQMLGSRTQYFDQIIANKVYPSIEWDRVPFFSDTVKISIEIQIADSDIEGIKAKIQDYAKSLIPR